MLNLKEIRQSKNKTQAEIADALQITRASYTNIENGKRDPDTQTLVAIADFLNVSMDEIFGRIQKTEKIPSSNLTAEEKRLLSYFRGFNKKGREKAMEELYMMTVSGIYKNSNNISNVEEAN